MVGGACCFAHRSRRWGCRRRTGRLGCRDRAARAATATLRALALCDRELRHALLGLRLVGRRIEEGAQPGPRGFELSELDLAIGAFEERFVSDLRAWRLLRDAIEPPERDAATTVARLHRFGRPQRGVEIAGAGGAVELSG